MPFTSPFPPLKLTAEEEKAQRETIAKLVHDACEDYDHLATSQRWTLVKEEKESALKVFCEHKADAEPFRFVTTGTVPGKIEDAVFACRSTDAHDVMLRSAYRSDGLQDCAVLHWFDKPTAAEPLRTASVHWTTHKLPLALDTVIKNPDATVLDSTGFATLPSGARVGYYVEHTIELPQLPPLKNYSRMQHTAVALFRQHDATHMDVYFSMTLPMKLQLVGTYLARYVGKKMIRGQDMTYVSTMRKLTWMLQHPAQALADAAATKCAACGTSADKNLPTCALCHRAVCPKCLHAEKLFAIVADDKLVEFTKEICSDCMTRVHEKSAVEVAKAEIHEDAAKPILPPAPSQAEVAPMSPTKEDANKPLLEGWRSIAW